MKSNKGVTLTSVIIYVIALVIVVALMGTFTSYFYKNLNEVTIKQNAQEEYTKFLSYLTKDVNSDNLIFVQSGVNGENCLIFKFDNGEEHQYIFQNGNLYYLNIDEQNEKKIILCRRVSQINTFDYSEGKIDIDIYINREEFSSSLSINIKS